jgi:hypothetical protein
MMIKFLISLIILSTISGAAWGSEREISVTVYNSNLGMVKDLRTIPLKRGTNEVEYTEVAAQLDPTSVHFKAPRHPKDIEVMEQNFRYDLASANRILEKHLDLEAIVAVGEGKTYSGKLLAFSDENLVLAPPDGGVAIVRREHVHDIALPDIPEGLMTRPTLVWLIESTRSGSEPCEVSYLTEGLNWHTEYVGAIGPKDQKMNTAGWVSIENRSGATYPDAKLKLAAGEIHRVQEYRERFVAFEKEAPPGVDTGFEERPLFEYHIYELGRRTTVRDRETKQIALFPGTEVSVTKVFIYDGARDGKRVAVEIHFVNDKASGLGMPLPAGKIRMFKEDTDGTLEFIGEDQISHTPKDEEIRLQVGNAFDIVGERIRVSRRTVSDRETVTDWEITIRNHKDETVTIVVVEHLYGDWTILKASHTYRKKDASTIECDLTVPANGEATFSYSVRIKS